mgnify:CR=1 FL=1|jgi:hypothetical protein|tara:strand:+ start:59 stop:286 length:228 start_codon:yes stop_codon:yes gene_type:complete
MVLDNMLMIDLLCDRGAIVKDMAKVVKNLDTNSVEYDVVTEFMVFIAKATMDSYILNEAEAAQESKHQGFPKGVN